ncbi:MAG: Gfo/Idh/MocA family oxidoreductase [Planctomycetota bacterium]
MESLRSRRAFLRQVALAGTVAPFADRLLAEQTQLPPNERLNLGIIGVSNRGAANLAGVARENIVALCDVDLAHVGVAKTAFPNAAIHQDFRKLLDHSNIDAVVISTPDHMHAIPAVMAMDLGKHIYCEKPLAHSVYETRVMREKAAKNKLTTQLGTQIHAGNNYRRVVEIVQSGAIGKVNRVHVWLAGRPQTGERVKEGTPPATLDYNLWLGPAPFRPYHKSHCHFHWRWWWDFGGGMLEDFGCHYIDLPFWALQLRYPTSIEATGEKDHPGDNEVPALMKVDYQFPARGDQPPVHLTWYHGGWKPEGADKYGMANAVLFVGEKGELIADYGKYKLYPEEQFKDFHIEPSIPESIGHHLEWLEAIRSSGETTCNFDYGGALTETVLLGNVSYRAGKKKLEWDAGNLKVTNGVTETAGLIQPEYRKGWTL